MLWRRIFKWVAAVVLLIIILSVLLPPDHGPQMNGYMTNSFDRMRQLARAISAYQGDNNGSVPKKWSDLCPVYISDPKAIFSFRSPYSVPVKDIDFGAHPELIDSYSPYRFMKLADNRIVVVEKPGFWKDGKITYCLQGPDDASVGDTALCHVPPEEFARRLTANFPDIPNENSDWDESDYGSGYQLMLDHKKMQAIHNAFLASGKSPIAAAAARAKAQAAMGNLDANMKWTVSAGVRTSDGSTPYYHFTCSFPEPLADRYNPMDVYILLDGTVIAPVTSR